MSKLEIFKASVNQLLSTAALGIFALYEKTLAECEEEIMCRFKQKSAELQRIMEDIKPGCYWRNEVQQQSLPEPPVIKAELLLGLQSDTIDANTTEPTSDSPTSQSSEDEEKGGLLPELKPIKTGTTEAIPSQCPSPGPYFKTNISPARTRSMTSSHPSSESEHVSFGEAESKTAEKPYQCEECNETFMSESNLANHIKLHTEESKQYQCEKCDKVFRRKASLGIHRRIHTGEKLYQCLECPKTFSFTSSLKSHRQIHTGGERPCEPSFVDSCHGKPILIHKLFTYTKERQQGAKSYWKCTSYSESKCRGRITVTDGLITKVAGAHNHLPSKSDVCARQILTKMKNRSLETQESTHQIYVDGISSATEAIAVKLPSKRSMKKMIQRHRKIHRRAPPEPHSDIVIADSYTVAGDPILSSMANVM